MEHKDTKQKIGRFMEHQYVNNNLESQLFFNG